MEVVAVITIGIVITKEFNFDIIILFYFLFSILAVFA